MKGKLRLEFNKNKTTAELVFSPDKDGREWTEKRIKTLLEGEGIREGILSDKIKEAEVAIKKADSEIRMLIAESEAPVPKSEGKYQWEIPEIPADLSTDAERVFKVAFDPEITIDRIKNIKVQKKVKQKSKLPFGRTKVGVVTTIEKKVIKEPVEVNPEVIMTGWADSGDILATRGETEEGKPGISVLGKELPAQTIEFFPGKGLKIVDNELIAEYSGFIRKGENWIEIIPFQHNFWIVSLSKDKSTALLKIYPEAKKTEVPSSESIIAKAVSLGIPHENIISESVISRIIKETVSSGSFLENFSLTGDQDSSYSVTASEDGLKGLLNMAKGSGNGKALKLNEVGEAIKKSGFQGLDFPKIKEDILAFYKSSSLEMKNYILIEGKAPEEGKEGTFSIECVMMKTKELTDHKEKIKNDYGKRKPAGIESLDDYPIENCKSIGIIEKNGTAVMFSPSKPGSAGKDIFGKVLPGLSGATPNLTILENLVRKNNLLIAEINGFLDVFEEENGTIVRVRPSENEIIIIEISEDKMDAYLSISENGSTPITEDEIKEKLVKAGVTKGLKEDILQKTVESSNGGEIVERVIIASGEAPVEPGTSRLNMNIKVADDTAVTLRTNGSADFKNQDRITAITKDDLIGTILSPKTEARDGWDVYGTAIKAQETPPLKIEIGKGIKKEVLDNGDISLIAEVSGELIQDKDKLFVNAFHMVKGDVDLKEGNIKFPGSVKIGGSVTQGFFIMSGGEVQIAGGVEASLVSAAESIIIGQGVVGGGKAILRSKRDIELSFAEQATLLAVGNIKAKNSCLRCKIKCNGKVMLVGDKGNLIGGNTKTTGGIDVGNLGNDNGIKTEVSFGQNYLVQDRIEIEEKEVEKIKTQLTKLDPDMHQLEKEGDQAQLKNTRLMKVKLMKIMEKRGIRLFTLRERFEEHFPSEIKVRGTMYPGVILESHGRYHEITSEKKSLIITFNLQTGKIEETAIKKEK